MNMIEQLTGRLREIDPSVDGIVSRSFPGKGKRFFYAYARKELKLIVHTVTGWSDDPGDGTSWLDIMENRLSLPDDSTLKRSILKPAVVLDMGSSRFYVSPYVKPAWRFGKGTVSEKKTIDLINLSCEWLVGFQRETESQETTGGIESLMIRLEEWQRRHRDLLSPDYDQLVRRFEDAASRLKQKLPRAACHGDFCHWNYFVDHEGLLRVYDWEFVEMAECVSRDYMTNLVVYAQISSKSKGKEWDFATLFSGGGGRRDVAGALAEKITFFGKRYGLSSDELCVYFVYAYFALLIRCTSEKNIGEKQAQAAGLLHLLA